MNEPLSSRRKTGILLTCCMSLLIVSMDVTVVNVALPAIRHDLGASMSQLQWVVDAYTLALASLLLLAGAAADRFGRKRVFRIGLVVFALGSLLCSLAGNIEMLIGARFLQGIGGSMLNPVAMSIIAQVFTGKAERARAIGVWGAVVGISMALGPILGGVLIDSLGWQSVFWLNLPVCAIAFLLTTILVPESKSTTVRGIDPVGQLLGVVFLGALVFGLIHGPELGWTDGRTAGIFLLSFAALAAFLRYEARRVDPFIDLRFFRSVPFSSATAIAVLGFATFSAFLFLNSLYLQGVRHFSAIDTGLLYLPLAVAALVFSPLSGRLVGKYGTRPSLLIAGSMMTLGALQFTQVTATTPVWQLLVGFGVFGIGFGLLNAPITTSAVSGMPLDRTGAASAVASTSRQVGASIGVALCGSVASTGPLGRPASFVAAMGELWWLLAILTAGIVGLGFASTSGWARRSSQRVAPLLAANDKLEVTPSV